ncbi:MAG: hypothetical protein MI919_25630, partial [Holophagales bacterium]|nr:hypothetical protein [Holophagales bacterium]
LDQPFFGTLLLWLKVEEDPAGTETLATDGKKLQYNPEYIDRLSLEHRVVLGTGVDRGRFFRGVLACVLMGVLVGMKESFCPTAQTKARENSSHRSMLIISSRCSGTERQPRPWDEVAYPKGW